MYRFVSLRVSAILLATAALASFAGPAAAGEAVPFKGRLDGTVTRTPLTPPFVKIDIAATGNATQLGAFKLSVPHIVDMSTTPRAAVGQYVFIAANGDMLVANFKGAAVPTATPGVLAIVEKAVFDPAKSTGRFAGATGSFTVERLFDTNTGLTSGAFTGAIASGKQNP